MTQSILRDIDDRIPIHLDPDLVEDEDGQHCINLLTLHLLEGFIHGHQGNSDFFGDRIEHDHC